MNDELIDRANPAPRDPRRASNQNRFERHSKTSCRLIDGHTGKTVAYLESDLLESVVNSNTTEKLIEALLCARRIASDEDFKAGQESIRTGMRRLMGLPQEDADGPLQEDTDTKGEI